MITTISKHVVLFPYKTQLPTLMRKSTLAKHVLSLPYHNQLPTEIMMITLAKDAMLVPYSTYPQYDDYSSKAKANRSAKSKGQASIEDNIYDQVEAIIPGLSDNTQHADTALYSDKESVVEDEHFIKAGEKVPLDVGNRSEVSEEDETDRDTDHNAE